MTISVLMSVYKAEKAQHLHEALQSVWADQTRKPDEIVVVRDGSLTEALDEVLQEWKTQLGEQLVILTNPQNVGLTKSLNKGLAYAKGELVARMDSDDLSIPGRFFLQEQYMAEHPDIAVVGGAIQEFDAENPCLAVRRYPLNPDEVRKYIHKASPLAHPAVMMRKAIFEKGIRYDERYRTSQDIALWFDVLDAGYQIGNLSDVVLHFRRDGDVFKRRSRAKAYNEFKIYMSGIRRLYGIVTWRYVFPIARLAFRLLPVSLVKRIYESGLRARVLEKKGE